MKANKSVISALLGVALLAMPITASARTHDDGRNRGSGPAYHKMPTYRSVVGPRANFGTNFRTNLTPRVVANNRLWSTAPIAPLRDRDYYRPVERYDGPIAPAYNPYPNSYGPYPNSYPQTYYPQAYGPAPQYYDSPVGGVPVGGGLANLVRQRDNAQMLYRQAVANGNRGRARHLLNDIIGLNKSIGHARTRGYGAAYGTLNPYANTYSNGYGNGNSGLGTLVGPLLGNYIR
jgi:hypothetical protein